MMTLIIGGSGSGKSAYAEEYMVRLSGERRKYYIATMQIMDEEGREKAARHQEQRSGKGFYTIEQPSSICKALRKMRETEKGTPRVRTALLECMSNLTANEMFSDETPKSCKEVTDKITREIRLLYRGLETLVIVTNNVFEDGTVYDDDSMEYIQALGSINEKLAAMADLVVEVVAGIPVRVIERN